MHILSQLAALCAAAVALAACSIDAVSFTLGGEDCEAAGACQAVCGNSQVEPGEGCDDGNDIDGDGCDSNCTLTECGNGIRTPGEQCDDGNRINGDGCESNCTFSTHFVPPDPALWLRFDDPPEDGVLDSSVYDTPARCAAGCPVPGPGRFEGAYLFRGTNRVDVLPSPVIQPDPNRGFTVAAWILLEALPPGRSAIACKNLGLSDCTFALMILSDGRAAFHTAGAPAMPGPPIQPGTWHHLAMTWKGTNRIGYVDGLPISPPVPASMPNDYTIPLSIGTSFSRLGLPFTGWIDDFVFYNRVLSPAELALLATP